MTAAAALVKEKRTLEEGNAAILSSLGYVGGEARLEELSERLANLRPSVPLSADDPI